jgi:class 3 adenylate cyclase
MAKMKASERANLPDSAFAYIDSRGRRRLPIHDHAHVRNALARFGRVHFESDAARDEARTRLLKAAKKFGIVPIGFIDGQLQTERLRARTPNRSIDPRVLPTGQVTLLLTDIEASTVLVRRLGSRYASLLERVRSVLRRAVTGMGGWEVDARADEFFAIFKRPEAAVGAAVEVQSKLSQQTWPDDAQVRVRIGIHSGRPTLTESGYVGLSVHTMARVCEAGHGGQILITDAVRGAVEGSLPEIRFRNLGLHSLQGLDRPLPLFQVEAPDLTVTFPPLRSATRESGARR